MYSYTKALRLNTADEFSSVFVFRKTINGAWLRIHYKPNESNCSRLGLTISKKNHKRAHRRNYMKRVIRELFRQQQPLWSGYDIIVRAHKCFMPADFIGVKQEFIQLTQKFARN